VTPAIKALLSKLGDEIEKLIADEAVRRFKAAAELLNQPRIVPSKPRAAAPQPVKRPPRKAPEKAARLVTSSNQMQQVRSTVLAFVQANPNSGLAFISSRTGYRRVTCQGALRTLVDTQELVRFGKNRAAVYMTAPQAEAATKPNGAAHPGATRARATARRRSSCKPSSAAPACASPTWSIRTATCGGGWTMQSAAPELLTPRAGDNFPTRAARLRAARGLLGRERSQLRGLTSWRSRGRRPGAWP
jgi:hypothetical protein